MKGVIKVFLRDLGRLKKNLIAMVIVVGMCVLPALYAWFNIAANWDPYSNTAGLKVAVVNNDKGYNLEDIYELDCGKQVVASLKENAKIGWEFVTEKEAKDGVYSNEYYAAVIIPDDFSENLVSFVTGDFKKPVVSYYVNEKINAIAPKITDKCMETIKSSIDTSFVSTLTNTAATFINASEVSIKESEDEMIDKMLKNLETVKTDITAYQSSISAFDSTCDALNEILKENKELIPTLETTLDDSQNIATTSKNAISSMKTTSSQLTSTVSGIITSMDTLYDNVDSELKSAFTDIENKAEGASEKLTNITSVNQQIIDVNNQLKDALQGLADGMGVDISKLTDKIDEANQKQQDIIDKLTETADTVSADGEMPADTQTEIESLVSQGRSAMTNIQNEYDTTTKQTIDKSVESVCTTMDDVSALCTSVSSELPKISSAFDSSSSAIKSIKEAMSATSDVLTTMTDKVTSIETVLNSIKDDDTLSQFLGNILSNPQDLSEFISSPVSVDENSVYPIENYGSAMSPFYTTLAIWVGGIVLIAILKTDVKEDDKLKNIRPSAAYFGRYLLFLSLGLIQSTIICLGDLFFLKIQCNHPFLFMVSGWISSAIFVLIIYTLTSAFGEIGKALSVIILVLQLAGSGGTFPVEVLPEFFQSIYPFLPFSYAINAMRETVAGLYSNYYVVDILKLFIYVPFALLLGLVLRKPLINVGRFFKKRLEDSHLM